MSGTVARSLGEMGDAMVGNANVNFDAGTLFIDGVNNSVGVGTAAPVATLQATGTSGTAQARIGTAAAGYIEVNAYDANPVYCVVGGSNHTAGVFGTQSNTPTIFFTNNTERMRIDTSGRITTSAQPAFHATSSNAPGNNTEWVFNATAFNRGSHFSTSTGRFTAPVAGVYYFYVYGLPANGDNSDIRISLRVNGSAYSSARFIITKNFNSWQTTYGNVVMSISANDYVSPWVDSAGAGFHTDNGYTGFGGYLLG